MTEKGVIIREWHPQLSAFPGYVEEQLAYGHTKCIYLLLPVADPAVMTPCIQDFLAVEGREKLRQVDESSFYFFLHRLWLSCPGLHAISATVLWPV